MNNTSKMLINRRLIAMLFLGFSSGLPFALTGSTLQAWFTEAHINIKTIGLLSLLGIPYILKFLWAPFLDYYRFLWLGRRRGWILASQLCVAATLLFLANLNPVSQAIQMSILALAIAFFSASQDIAIDAYRTDILAPTERGLGSAYFVFAYRVAILISGGLALLSADHFGWKMTYDMMAFLILISMIPVYYSPTINEEIPTARHLFQSFSQSLQDLLQREKIIWILLFVICYRLGASLEVSLMTNFLLQGLGFSLTEVGLAYKTAGVIAAIIGSFVCGILLTRWSTFQALLWFGIIQAFSNLMFIVMTLTGKHFVFMFASLFVENFCTGMTATAFLVFLMSLCNRRFTAGQFALLSTIDSLGRIFLGPVAGLIVEDWGWVQLFIWSFILCFPGIIFLYMLKDKVFYYAQATVD